MINPIEQEFYKMFNISKISCKTCKYSDNCSFLKIDCPYCEHLEDTEPSYPQITDHRLLELVCLYTSIRNLNRCCDTIEKLKNEILNNLCIIYYYTRNNEEKNALYHDVRKIMGVIKDE